MCYNVFTIKTYNYKEIRAMAHYNTIINQIAAILPRHEFEYLANIHHMGQKFRSFNRWSQFLAMMIAQLSSRNSLRDVVANIKAQMSKLYHLGMRLPSRMASLIFSSRSEGICFFILNWSSKS